jgi:hypothetical protein
MEQIVLCFADAQALHSSRYSDEKSSWSPDETFLNSRFDLPGSPMNPSRNPDPPANA